MAKINISKLILVFCSITIINVLYWLSHEQDRVFIFQRTGNFQCDIPRLITIEDFFMYGKRIKHACKRLKRYGGSGYFNDGSKVVCQDFVMVPGKCTVLSFGINNEWSFDDAMAEIGCEVYAFDPSMEMKDYKKSKHIHFYNIGISNVKKRVLKGTMMWKLDRYENILKNLSLTDVDIDYLKMDIEGGEIPFMNDIVNSSIELMKRVKQIGMEIHVGTPPSRNNEAALRSTPYHKIWKLMHHMECLGFTMANYEMNPIRSNHFIWKDHQESNTYEILWVKMQE